MQGLLLHKAAILPTAGAFSVLLLLGVLMPTGK